jgi:septal ring factor EnvC (AmiA/AmiB activator)
MSDTTPSSLAAAVIALRDEWRKDASAVASNDERARLRACANALDPLIPQIAALEQQHARQAETIHARQASWHAMRDRMAALEQQHAQAHEYLSRLLTHYAPQCEPLSDLLGVCSQIDNLLTAATFDFGAQPSSWRAAGRIGDGVV